MTKSISGTTASICKVPQRSAAGVSSAQSSGVRKHTTGRSLGGGTYDEMPLAAERICSIRELSPLRVRRSAFCQDLHTDPHFQFPAFSIS